MGELEKRELKETLVDKEYPDLKKMEDFNNPESIKILLVRLRNNLDNHTKAETEKMNRLFMQSNPGYSFEETILVASNDILLSEITESSENAKHVNLQSVMREFVHGTKDLERWNKEDKTSIMETLYDILEEYHELLNEFEKHKDYKNNAETSLRTKVEAIAKMSVFKDEKMKAFKLLYDVSTPIEQGILIDLATEFKLD